MTGKKTVKKIVKLAEREIKDVRNRKWLEWE